MRTLLIMGEHVDARAERERRAAKKQKNKSKTKERDFDYEGENSKRKTFRQFVNEKNHRFDPDEPDDDAVKYTGIKIK